MNAAIFLGKCEIAIALTGEWHCHLLINALAPLFHLLAAFHCWSQVKEKFHSSGSLCCWGKMGIYSLLTMFSWKLTASSQTPPCFGAGPHSGTYSWLRFPPDNVSSKRFFRDCSNGPAIHCEMVLNEIAFLWQLCSKTKKRLEYQIKKTFSGHTLRKTLLGNAYHRKLTYQVLKYSLGHVACHEPVLFLESCQSSMTLKAKTTHTVCFKDHLC